MPSVIKPDKEQKIKKLGISALAPLPPGSIYRNKKILGSWPSGVIQFVVTGTTSPIIAAAGGGNIYLLESGTISLDITVSSYSCTLNFTGLINIYQYNNGSPVVSLELPVSIDCGDTGKPFHGSVICPEEYLDLPKTIRMDFSNRKVTWSRECG